MKAGAAIGQSDMLGTELSAVVVIKAYGIIFSMAPHPFTVFIVHITGDVDRGHYTGSAEHHFKHIFCAHDIGRISFNRLNIGITRQLLGGDVNVGLRHVFCENSAQLFQDANITNDTGHDFASVGDAKQAGIGRCSAQTGLPILFMGLGFVVDFSQTWIPSPLPSRTAFITLPMKNMDRFTIFF